MVIAGKNSRIFFLLISSAAMARAASLVDTADAIVFGDIQSGQQTGKVVSFILLVDRTIKGNVQAGTLLSVGWDNGFYLRQYPNRPLSGFYGIWFLKSKNGTWNLGRYNNPISVEHAYLPVPRTTTPAYATSAVPVSPGDQIASALLPQILHYTDVWKVSHLASALLAVEGTPLVLDMYRQLVSSPDVELHFIGLAGLAGAHDAAARTELAGRVDQIPSLKLKHLQFPLIGTLGDGDPGRLQG